jgi:hypothetical protein
MKQRLQVDIKPNHQMAVRALMKKLGDVSGADAIGFLIETQMSAALARLEPFHVMPQRSAENPQVVVRNDNAPQRQPQEVVRSHQSPKPVTASHTTPQDDAANALDALLSA